MERTSDLMYFVKSFFESELFLEGTVKFYGFLKYQKEVLKRRETQGITEPVSIREMMYSFQASYEAAWLLIEFSSTTLSLSTNQLPLMLLRPYEEYQDIAKEWLSLNNSAADKEIRLAVDEQRSVLHTALTDAIMSYVESNDETLGLRSRLARIIAVLMLISNGFDSYSRLLRDLK